MGSMGGQYRAVTGTNGRITADDHHPGSHRNVAVLMIGGTLHTGELLLAKHLTVNLGLRHYSSDSIAWHSGRPFRTDGSNHARSILLTVVHPA